MGQTSSKGGTAPSSAPAPSVAPIALSTVRTGSIVLLKESVSSSGLGQLDASLVRAMVAAQKGGFFSAQQQRLATWTHCGLVLAHKGRQYLVLPTLKGIDVLPAAKQIQKWQAEGMKVAIRQLMLPPTSAHDQEQLNRLSRDLLQAALSQGGLSWDRFLPELQTDAGGRPVGLRPGQLMPLPFLRRISISPTSSAAYSSAAPSASSLSSSSSSSSPPKSSASASSPSFAPTASSPLSRPGNVVSAQQQQLQLERRKSVQSERSTSSATTAASGSSSVLLHGLSDFARTFLKMLIPRVWAALMAISPQVEVELRRAFAKADHDGDGFVPLKSDVIRAILTDVRGSEVSLSEASAFMKLMQVPSARKGAVEALSSSASFTGSGFLSPSPASATATTSPAKREDFGLRSISFSSGNGNSGSPSLVSLDHFLFAMARRPLKEIPIEIDLKAILGGEFVAVFFEMLGLLPTRTACTLSPTPSPVAMPMTKATSPAVTARTNSAAITTATIQDDGIGGSSGSGVFASGAGGAVSSASCALTNITTITVSPRHLTINSAEAASSPAAASARASGGADAGRPGPETVDLESQTSPAVAPLSPPRRMAFGESKDGEEERKEDYDADGTGNNTASAASASASAVAAWPVTMGIASQPGRRRSSVPTLDASALAQATATAASSSRRASLDGSGNGSVTGGSTTRRSSGTNNTSTFPPHLQPGSSSLSSSSSAQVSVVPILSGRSDTNASRASAGSGGHGSSSSSHHQHAHSHHSHQHQQGGINSLLGSPLATSSPWNTSGSNASHHHHHHGSAGGSGSSGSSSGGVIGTIVVIDSTCGDLRHFTPSTFGSGFEPKLTLLKGKLEPEALVVVDGVPPPSQTSPAPAPAPTPAPASALSTNSRRSPAASPAAAAVQPLASPVSAMFREAAAAASIPEGRENAEGKEGEDDDEEEERAAGGVAALAPATQQRTNRKLAWLVEGEGEGVPSSSSASKGSAAESKWG